MDKKTIVFLKTKFPRLFATVARSPLLARTASELDRARYIYCLTNKKPYFGTVALAAQTWEERKPYMRRLVAQEIEHKNDFHLLEVGSWAGNSAVLWADAIKASKRKGTVICVDPWRPYIKESKEKVNSASILMNRALRNDSIFKLFLHNIRTSHHADTIYPFKGPSDQVLPLLQERSFDIAYIDGDHSYSGIKKDLFNAVRLIRDGGVICGDDFDIALSEIDRNYGEAHKETNIVIDPKTTKTYHPGVCLAVSEFFETEISSYCGFWAMRKKGSQWQKVAINL